MAEKQVSLKLLVDKKKNRVLSADAGKDFVDALLSFLTLPLGTIARIVGKDSNLKPIRVGSLSSLYESVANLDDKYFSTETCKEMLLRPRNSMESLQNPKLNIDDSDPIKYFICDDWNCSRKDSGGLYSTFKNKRCRCGKAMNRQIRLSCISNNHEGYVNELAAFTVSDELNVIPNNLDSSIVALLKNLGIEDINSIEEISVNINKNEVLDLLKCSLLSKTPLTDLFLRKKENEEDYELPYGSFPFDFEIGKVSALASLAPAEDSKHMKVKVMVKKSESKILFAQAEEDFADFLLSFLTLPLGAVLNLLQGNSGSICSDNLFKSLADLHGDKHLKSEEIKKMLIKPQIASQFRLQNQILPVDEAIVPNYSCHSTAYQFDIGDRKGCLIAARMYNSYSNGEVYAPVTLLDHTSSSGGFAKGPTMFMVADDLVVTPFSSISVASLLNKFKVPFHDLEERVINIGLEEGLSILKASLISPSALTMGLSPFMSKTSLG